MSSRWGDEWFEEGLRQLRLAGWCRLQGRGRAASSAATDAALPARMLPLLLQPRWWPWQLGEVLDALLEQGVLDHPRQLERYADGLRHSLAGKLSRWAQDGNGALERRSLDGDLPRLVGESQKAAVEHLADPRSSPALADLDRLPADRLEASEYVRNWIAMAEPLALWLLRPDPVTPPAAPSDDSDLRATGEAMQECLELREVVQRRNAAARMSRWLWPHLYRDYHLFDQVVGFLERVETRLAEQVESDGADNPEMAAAIVDGWLRLWPTSWPPAWLARLTQLVGPLLTDTVGELLPCLRQDLDRDTFKVNGNDFPPGIQARLLLLTGVVGVLDSAAAPGEVWSAVVEAVPRLFEASGFTVKLVRDDKGNPPAWFDEPRIDSGLSEPRLGQTGIVARNAVARSSVIRKARVDQPPAPPAWRGALDRLDAWLRTLDHADVDPYLAGLSQRFRHQFGTENDLAAWWRRPGTTDEVRSLLWRLIQRAATLPILVPRSGSVVASLLDAFAQEGFRLGEWSDGIELPTRATGPWFVTEESHEGTGVRYAPMLRGPDNRWFGPTAWLAVRKSQPAGRPLLRCLREADDVLARIKAAEAMAWPGWEQTIVPLLREAARPTKPIDEHDLRVARRLFEALYQRWREVDTAHAETAPLYRDLAGRFHALVLGELGLRLVPDLDRRTFLPRRIRRIPEEVTVHFAMPVDRQRLGELVAYGGFTVAGKPADWTVAVDPKAYPWLILPDPPSFDIDGDMIVPTPLRKLRARLLEYLGTPGKAHALVQRARAELESWLTDRAGQLWFDQLVRAAQQGLDPAQEWAQALARQLSCRCFPAVEWATGRVYWPEDCDMAQRKHVKREYNELPAGQVLQVELFAPDPDRARCAVSLGPRPAGALTDLARQLVQTAQTPPLLRKLLHAPIGKLAQSLPAGATASQREQTALAILDRLGAGVEELTEAGEADVLLLDQVLELLRRWLSEQGLELLPRHWSFFELPMRETLEDEAPEPEVIFSEAPCGQVIHVNTFGLARQDGSMLRPSEVCLSAGPAPAHVHDMEHLVASRATSWETALADCLACLPAAELEQSRLPVNIEDLFDAFWEHQDAWSVQDDTGMHEFKMHLEAMLRDEYHLTMFEPLTIYDREPTEHWLEIQGEIRAGNVTRVLKAGLITEEETPLRKAHVEVD